MAEDDSTEMGRTMARMKERAAQAEANADQRNAETPKQLFLPGFDIGTMPNHLNRSSLFAPVARGRRSFYRQEVMVSRRDCALEYTGEQLDEADADLIMALIWFAQPYPIGSEVPITRANLLHKLGRRDGKNDYEWLRRRIRALTEATIFLEAYKPDGSSRYRLGQTYGFHILSAFYYDEDSATYFFRLDPRWVTLFSNREYALLDWEARLQIGRGQDMAKTLQRLIACTRDQVQRYALDRLKEQMVYGGRMRDFRIAIKRATDELERLNVIAGAYIDRSTKGKPQLVVQLSSTPSG